MSDLHDSADVYITEDGEWIPIGKVESVEFTIEHADRDIHGYTQNEELEALAEKWLEAANKRPKNDGRDATLRQCAAQLRNLTMEGERDD